MVKCQELELMFSLAVYPSQSRIASLESNIFNAEKSLMMAKIEASVEVKGSIDKIWEVVSDLDNEPRFWKGTKEVKNISKEGNTVKREITIAFKDKKCNQDITLYPKERIQFVFTKGIIEGTKTINLSEKGEHVKLNAIWDIKLSGMMGMFTGMISKHIKNGTEQALQSIKEEIE